MLKMLKLKASLLAVICLCLVAGKRLWAAECECEGMQEISNNGNAQCGSCLCTTSQVYCEDPMGYLEITITSCPEGVEIECN